MVYFLAKRATDAHAKAALYAVKVSTRPRASSLVSAVKREHNGLHASTAAAPLLQPSRAWQVAPKACDAFCWHATQGACNTRLTRREGAHDTGGTLLLQDTECTTSARMRAEPAFHHAMQLLHGHATPRWPV